MNNDPHHINALFTQAFALQQEGHPAEAIQSYKTLLEQSPTHLDALRFISLIHVEQNDMPHAIHYLERALALQPDDPRLHNNLASAYKKSGNQEKALQHYHAALKLAPNYAEAHHNLATIYALQSEDKLALHHYKLALHAEPDNALTHYHLGLLLLKTNQLVAAKKQFNNVITLNPEHVAAHFYIGLLALEANALDAAEEAFQHVIENNSEHVDALINMGVIALKKEQGQRAIDYFTKALALDNHNIDARHNIAATFIHHDRFENALMHYDVLLQQQPHHLEYLYNMGVAQMSLGHLQEAITHFNTLLTQDANHLATLTNLAAVYSRLDQREQAIALLKQAVLAHPNDATSQFMLNAMTGQQNTHDACPTYVNHLFNNYALYYDNHVQNALNYALPGLIGKLLHQLNVMPVQHAIDLGCGTGLCGPVLRSLSHRLTGVDIAAKMLAQARDKGLYDELIESDIVSYLQQEHLNHLDNLDHAEYQLAIAADVLPYLGDLTPLFKALSPKITHQGLFIFTHEISDNEPMTLQHNARFAHHPDAVQTLCAQQGFKIIHQEKVIARLHNQCPVYVMLYAVSNSGVFA